MPLPQQSLSWREQLWKAADRQKSDQKTSSKSNSQRLDWSAVAADYEKFAQQEFKDIQDRLIKLHEKPKSDSRPKILGWLYTRALKQENLFDHGISREQERDPRISAVELKIKYRSWLASHAELHLEREKTFINSLASFRYILYCYCVALDLGYDRKHLFDPILEGLRKRSTDVDRDQDRLAEIIDQLIHYPEKDLALARCQSVLRLFSGLAPRLSVELHELVAEERSVNRSGVSQERRNIIEKENSITHKIEIYFLEKPGTYSVIFQKILRGLELNLIKTQSEMMTPEKVAKVTLLVYYPLRGDLKKEIGNRIEAHDLTNVVFAHFVQELST